MRWVPFIVTSLVASAAQAGPLSNPAFLGILMSDQFMPGPTPQAAPVPLGCLVERVTKGSAAQEAGLRDGDLILAMDGVITYAPGVRPCDVLKNQIVSHPPGDVVQLDVRRVSQHVALKVSLSTRAEVLSRRFVGHPMEAAELIDADHVDHRYELGDQHGHTTVIGWFTLDRCTGCGPVFERVSDELQRRSRGGGAAQVLAVTSRGLRGDLSLARKAFTSSVPLAVAENETFQDLAIDDPERVHFMVVDCRGIVRFVAPIAPDSDDLDAAVDEVLAAAEQAEHARTSRR